MPNHPTEPIETDAERPSKSQVKREMHALLELGKRLVELSADRLRELPLEEKLYDAIREAQRIPGREGRRRQVHYVGKLMRAADANAIRSRLDAWENGSREQTAAMHRLENLRELLLRDDQALTRLLDEYPGADAQQLRTLIRAGRKEAQNNAALGPGQEPQRKHYRALFQALKALDEAQDPDPESTTETA